MVGLPPPDVSRVWKANRNKAQAAHCRAQKSKQTKTRAFRVCASPPTTNRTARAQAAALILLQHEPSGSSPPGCSSPQQAVGPAGGEQEGSSCALQRCRGQGAGPRAPERQPSFITNAGGPECDASSRGYRREKRGTHSIVGHSRLSPGPVLGGLSPAPAKAGEHLLFRSWLRSSHVARAFWTCRVGRG